MSHSRILQELRDLVYEGIQAEKTDNKFVINNFDVRRSYYPHTKLTELPEGGLVTVIGLGADDLNLSREYTFTRETPIQIALQKYIEGDPGSEANTEIIDQLVTLGDELRDCVRLTLLDNQRYSWIRTESLKDENSTPYYFMTLREANTFELFSTSFFKSVLTSK